MQDDCRKPKAFLQVGNAELLSTAEATLTGRFLYIRPDPSLQPAGNMAWV